MNGFGRRLEELGLVLEPAELERIRALLLSRLHEGLRERGREIAMLPAFLPPPEPETVGEAVAVDAGGTNLRAARVRLRPGGDAELASEVEECPLPGAAGRAQARAEQFFGAHGELLERLGDSRALPLGYCFSYPIRCQPDGDAVLERWTKEVRVGGVVGQPVGKLLRGHLEARGIRLGTIAVLNDTIAALMAGSLAAEAATHRSVGLIVGTGTNMGAYLPVRAMDKLGAERPPYSHMAVNFESGAFSPPLLGQADELVDRASVNPGAQRFEKAVSGAYLGRLFTAASSALGLPMDRPAFESDDVSELAAEPAEAAPNALARALVRRSADLVAAALAATAALLDGDGPLCVCAEGSLFWKAPGFADRVRETLDRMLRLAGHDAPSRFFSAPHANLVGSAAAALGAR